MHIYAKWSNLNITTTTTTTTTPTTTTKDNGVTTLTFHGHVTMWLAVIDFRCDPASIWHWYKDTAPQSTCTHPHTQTDKTTNLLISSNVHYVHLGGDNYSGMKTDRSQICVNLATKNYWAWPANRQSKNRSPGERLGDGPINRLKWQALCTT